MKNFYIILTLVALAACQQQNNKARTNELKKEVMAIHDEVMPATSHLLKLRNELKNVSANDSTQTVALQPCIDSLKLAHDKMMEWMNNYNHSYSETDTTYFIEQREQISIVNKLYKATISSAEQKLK